MDHNKRETAIHLYTIDTVNSKKNMHVSAEDKMAATEDLDAAMEALEALDSEDPKARGFVCLRRGRESVNELIVC